MCIDARAHYCKVDVYEAKVQELKMTLLHHLIEAKVQGLKILIVTEF